MGFVRSFFSGVESGQHYQAAVDAGAEHLLMSYLYIKKQQGNILATRKQATPRLKFLIDSGAHTLQISMGKAPYNTWTQKDLETYVQEYAEFLEKNKQYIFAAVELDIAYSINVVAGKPPLDTYGDHIVDGWRKKYFLPLQQRGMSIIYVWHDSQGYAGWEDLCANYPYVGLPGEMSSNQDFNTYLSVAKRYTTKVHGFAATKQADFRDWPWYSIDSTTWKAGEIYGTLPVWNEHNQRLRFVAKGEREPYRQIFERQGLDANKIIQDTDYQEVTRSSLKSMTGMELFYKDRYKDRTFYYELRLPPPARTMTYKDKDVMFMFRKKFNAEKVFPAHAQERDPTKIREFLHALSCAQYREAPSITKTGTEFLKKYFPQIFQSTIIDTALLSKEVSMLISPGNEAALRRECEDDYLDGNNPPKPRTDPFAIPEDDEFPEGLILALTNERFG